MEEKEVLTFLTQILQNYPLTDQEMDAIKHAIGVLSWTKLRSGAIQNIKRRQLEKRKRPAL